MVVIGNEIIREHAWSISDRQPWSRQSTAIFSVRPGTVRVCGTQVAGMWLGKEKTMGLQRHQHQVAMHHILPLKHRGVPAFVLFRPDFTHLPVSAHGNIAAAELRLKGNSTVPFVNNLELSRCALGQRIGCRYRVKTVLPVYQNSAVGEICQGDNLTVGDRFC